MSALNPYKAVDINEAFRLCGQTMQDAGKEIDRLRKKVSELEASKAVICAECCREPAAAVCCFCEKCHESLMDYASHHSDLE